MFVFGKFGLFCFLQTGLLRFAYLTYYRRFRIKLNHAPVIMIEVLMLQNAYILIDIDRDSSHETFALYGMEVKQLLFWVKKKFIWSYKPNDPKERTSLNEFRLKTKTWQLENCPCKLCEIYLQ